MTIDERLQALTESLELLRDQTFENSKHISELRQVSEAHEREMQRFRNAMRAALVAWLEGENGNEPQQG
jgi:hypothetical protein